MSFVLLLKDDSRISALPDEVLVSILSFLTIKEAGMTSVLSHRWKNLWTFFSGNLNFDVTEDMSGMLEESWPFEVFDYISCMNPVLPRLVGSSTLDDFTLRFVNYAFDQKFKTHIDRCVEFAMGKRIQRIELDTNPIEFGYAANDVPLYNFSDEFCSWIKQPCGLHNISALTSLSLNYVNVSGEFIDYLLLHCPLLERLRVVTSNQLLNLKLTGAASALKLKYLEISNCYHVESVEISSAPNLLSLTYIGNRTRLRVENVPQLVEVSIGCDVITYMSSSSISSYLSQLETLRLDFTVKNNKKFTQFLVLKKLRHLTLRAKFNKESLLGWTSLIDASPCLQKFTLENITPEQPDYRRKAQKVTSKHSHQCLKVVELVGFTGCATEVELAMYFLANATSLEQIIIDRRDPLVLGTYYVFRRGNLKARKKRGLELKRYLPPGVDLVVI